MNMDKCWKTNQLQLYTGNIAKAEAIARHKTRQDYRITLGEKKARPEAIARSYRYTLTWPNQTNNKPAKPKPWHSKYTHINIYIFMLKTRALSNIK